MNNTVVVTHITKINNTVVVTHVTKINNTVVVTHVTKINNTVVVTHVTKVVVTQVGDQILSINEESTEGLTHSEAVEQLKAIEGTIRLEVIQGESLTHVHTCMCVCTPA